MNQTLNPTLLESVLSPLADANQSFSAFYPGESPRRQPIHTVYGGAHLFTATTASKIGQLALKSLDANAPTFVDLAQAVGLPGNEDLPRDRDQLIQLQTRLAMKPRSVRDEYPAAWLAYTVFQRVVEKLKREAVEDFRIDFEDGFGQRPDAVEDKEAMRTAEEVARGMLDDTLPPFIGIRIKPFSDELMARSARTLDLFVTTLIAWTDGKLPNNFVVTLPKVTHAEQVSALVTLFQMLEARTALSEGALKMEIMVETTQSIIGPNGGSTLPSLISASRGRCVAAHFGVYDYTASCNITAAHQSMIHPACDFARHAMQVALGGTGIWLSDGATNVMPVAPHATPRDGSPLTNAQENANRLAIQAILRLNADHIRHSLKNGYYQGWDLHPAQLPIRYATVISFFLEGLDAAARRLRNFIDKAAQATLAGDVFDDAATGQALLNFFLRAINCGAVSEEEVSLTGLSLAEIRTRSFHKILIDRSRTDG